MKVNIDGYDYQLAAGEKVVRQPILEFPQHLRMTGQQRREDRSLISSWWQEDFAAGFGCHKIVNVESERQMSSFWDSEVNTVYPGQVTLPALRHQATFDIAATWGAFSATKYFPPDYVFEYGGTVYSYKRDGINILMSSLQIDASGNANWASFYTTTGTYNDMSDNMIQYRGKPCFLEHRVSSVPIRHKIYLMKCVPTPAAMFTTATEYNLDSEGVSVFNVTKGRNEFWWVSNNGDKLYRYNVDREELKQKSTGAEAPIALFPFTGRDTVEGMYAAYKNRLSCFESSGETGSNYIPIEVTYLDFVGQGGEENAAAVKEWNQAIQFPMDENLVSYYRDGTVTEIGMNLFSGMPTDKKGSITEMLPTLRRLFAKVPVGTQSYVFQNDTTAWHYFGKTPIGSLKTSVFMGNITEGSSVFSPGTHLIPALHLVALQPGTEFHHYYWKFPLDNPLTTNNYRFEATGNLTLPQFDGGIPNEQANMFKQTMDVHQYWGTYTGAGLALPGYIEAKYGMNGTSAGYFVSAGAASVYGLTRLSLGGTTGAVGIRYQPRFEFHRSSGASMLSNCPVMYSGVMEYLKLPNIRETFKMKLDLTRTAMDGTVAVATLANNLYDLRNTKTFVNMYYYEGTIKSDVFHVKMVSAPSTELTPEHADSGFQYQRQLVVEVAFAELAG